MSLNDGGIEAFFNVKPTSSQRWSLARTLGRALHAIALREEQSSSAALRDVEDTLGYSIGESTAIWLKAVSSLRAGLGRLYYSCRSHDSAIEERGRMDKALVGLMEDLDSGKAGPAFLKLMVGNMLVFGEPCSEKDFAETFIWAETDLGMKKVRRRDRTEETRQQLAQDVATNGHPLLRMLRDTSTATGDAVCLKEVTALIWTTESMTVPAMRIPIDKITAWWAGDADFKSSGGGGGWFGGVVLPLGN